MSVASLSEIHSLNQHMQKYGSSGRHINLHVNYVVTCDKNKQQFNLSADPKVHFVIDIYLSSLIVTQQCEISSQLIRKFDNIKIRMFNTSFIDAFNMAIKQIENIIGEVHKDQKTPNRSKSILESNLNKFIDDINRHAGMLGIRLTQSSTSCNCCNQKINDNLIEDKWGGYICEGCLIQEGV